MASSTPLKELEENFFLCPTCLERLKEPKLLPCLHRHCRDCLKAVINRSNDGKIKCPMCTQQCDIPDTGIDGFMTDFHTKSVVEFIQSQKSFESKDLKECVSCSKKTHVLAYCFKCKDFLCEQCYNVHITNKMFIDHKQRTLKLYNTEGRNMTIDKLATNKASHQCSTHIEESASLCCGTCANTPICTICSFSKHKGHELHDVTELAKTERELLKMKLSELQKLKSNFYELPKNVEATKHKLNENTAKKTDILINQHKEQVTKIKDKIEEGKNKKKHGLADIEKRRKDEEKQTNLNYEEEVDKLNKSYNEIRKATERKYNSERQYFTDSCEKTESELGRKLEVLDVYLKTLTEAKDLLMDKHKQELAQISHTCDQIIERYESFTAVSSSILVANDQWTQVQFIPDIRIACGHLIDEMKEEYPKLDFLSDILFVTDMPNLLIENITISGHEQPDAKYINGLIGMGGIILGMKINRNGGIIVSGGVSKECSHITVISRRGEIKRQDQIKKEKETDVRPERYCLYLTEFKVATVCRPDEIGIYDIRDGSYTKKYISDVIRSSSADLRVYCVGSVALQNHILVGTNSRYVYVFDCQLNYIHTITLPEVIRRVNDVTVHKGTLVICDEVSKGAYAVTMDESECTLIYELTKPELLGESNVRPFRVCKDKNDLIYMLWRGNVSDGLICNLVQYSQDGQQLLTMTKVDEDAISLAIAEVDESEKNFNSNVYYWKVV